MKENKFIPILCPKCNHYPYLSIPTSLPIKLEIKCDFCGFKESAFFTQSS